MTGLKLRHSAKAFARTILSPRKKVYAKPTQKSKKPQHLDLRTYQQTNSSQMR